MLFGYDKINKDRTGGDVVMTVRQEAHGLIDRMPEESVRALIPVMAKLIPFRKKPMETHSSNTSPKMQAFRDMQEMRKASVKYDFSETQRTAAMAEKYGDIEWGNAE